MPDDLDRRTEELGNPEKRFQPRRLTNKKADSKSILLSAIRLACKSY